VRLPRRYARARRDLEVEYDNARISSAAARVAVLADDAAAHDCKADLA
jgi:hypothetical protein